MINPSPYPEIMTIEQAAGYLQLHPQVVYRHVRAGTLPASRIGRTIRFKRSGLDAYLERGAWVYANAFLDYVSAARNAKAPLRSPFVTQAAPPHHSNRVKAATDALSSVAEPEAAPLAARGPFS